MQDVRHNKNSDNRQKYAMIEKLIDSLSKEKNNNNNIENNFQFIEFLSK